MFGCQIQRCCSENFQCLQVSNRIVHHVQTDDMELLKEVVLASRHVTSRVYKQLDNNTAHNHIWFLQQTAGDRRCASMRGNLFEEFVVETQSQGGKIKYPCKAHSSDPKTPGRRPLNLPLPPNLTLSAIAYISCSALVLKSGVQCRSRSLMQLFHLFKATYLENMQLLLT